MTLLLTFFRFAFDLMRSSSSTITQSCIALVNFQFRSKDFLRLRTQFTDCFDRIKIWNCQFSTMIRISPCNKELRSSTPNCLLLHGGFYDGFHCGFHCGSFLSKAVTTRTHRDYHTEPAWR